MGQPGRTCRCDNPPRLSWFGRLALGLGARAPWPTLRCDHRLRGVRLGGGAAVGLVLLAALGAGSDSQRTVLGKAALLRRHALAALARDLPLLLGIHRRKSAQRFVLIGRHGLLLLLDQCF